MSGGNWMTGQWMQMVVVLSAAMLVWAGRATAQGQTTTTQQTNAQQVQLSLMPWPAKVELGSGRLSIDGTFSVEVMGYTEARLDRAVQRFLRQMGRETGIPAIVNARTGAALPRTCSGQGCATTKKNQEGPLSGTADKQKVGATTATLTVHTERASKEVQELGEDESYTLEVTADGAKIEAANPLGAMHGLQTFLQLVTVGPDGFVAPAVKIEDKPRFAWRGLMIDVSRHFIPLEVLRRNIDGMEAVKMNVFHWHLSENQGFRVESKKFPKLHTLGSDGLFYTQEEIRELIGYARSRA